MTWAPIEDYASTEGFGDPNDTYYKEGVYVGYRYFDTIGYVPTYPFGYGMGYTTFTVDGFRSSKPLSPQIFFTSSTALVSSSATAPAIWVLRICVSAPIRMRKT